MSSLENKIRQLEKRIIELEGNNGTLHISVVQDSSGSMMGREEATISGFNEYLKTLKRDKDGTPVRLTLTQFDTTYRTLYEDNALADVNEMTNEEFIPGGATALLDAVGDTITRLSKVMDSADRALVLVMTDGYENSSRRFNHPTIVDLIKEKEGTGRWTFVYLGADQDAWAAGTSLGFRGGNTYSYAGTSSGISSTFSGLAGVTNTHKRSRRGMSASFGTDVAKDAAENIWVPGGTDAAETTDDEDGND